VRLEIRPSATTTKCDRRALLARRVCQLLADELALLEGVSVSQKNQPATASADALIVDITNDFAAEAFFDAFHVHFTVQLSDDEEPHEYRDSFASVGLVRVDLPMDGPEDVLITAEKPDDGLALDLAVKSREWFLLPVGTTYRRITVRSKAGVWQPATITVGLQNIWRPAPVAANSTPQESQFAQARHEAVSEETGSRRLEILSPADGATVMRCSAVTGKAVGFEGCAVEVVITPVGDIDYPQGSSFVRDGGWRTPRCIFGRYQDSGQQFCVKARGRCADGTFVESPTIGVTRQ